MRRPPEAARLQLIRPEQEAEVLTNRLQGGVLTSLQTGRTSLQPPLEVREVAYWTTRTVEPFALLAERLAACILFDVLGRDAIAGLANAVVVVDLRVGRVPWAFDPQGTGGLPDAVRS